MPRMARKDLITQYFHVMPQGINKEFIFETDQLKGKYKNLLRKYIRESDAKILAYCLMGNHVHILFQAVNPYDITRVMQMVNTNFARYYNYINGRVGIVFRNRYFTQPIMSREQLYNCLVYIHNNPVKARNSAKCKRL